MTDRFLDDVCHRLARAAPTRRGALRFLALPVHAGLSRLLGAAGVAAKPGGRKRKRRRQRRRDRRRNRRTGRALYPDLRTMPPSDLVFDILPEPDGRHILRFTNTVWNAGQGRLELQGDPDPNGAGTKNLYQNLYDAPIGGRRVIHRRVRGRIEYHPTHNHYHFADFASYLLLKQDAAGVYQPVGQGTKTSFCITDNVRVEATGLPHYVSCQRTLQGLSPGWGDTYRFDLPEQWVVLDEWPLPDGSYGVQSTADPRLLLAEGGGERETNNAATTYFTVENGEIQIGPEDSSPQ